MTNALINKYETGINRYIVGCKLAAEETSTLKETRINRYIVGCKLIADCGVRKLLMN